MLLKGTEGATEVHEEVHVHGISENREKRRKNKIVTLLNISFFALITST